MSQRPTDIFSGVSDVVESDFEYLTRLRERLVTPSLAFSELDQQAVRRLYVRMFITLIEGTVATFRSQVLGKTKNLDHAELAVLREVTYDVNEKGMPIERPLHPPLLNSIRFAFRMLAKTYGLRYQPDYSEKGWSDLQEVIRLRNRLTHPKNVEHMQVTVEEMEKVDSAEIWFVRSHRRFLEESNQLMKKELQKLEQSAGA